MRFDLDLFKLRRGLPKGMFFYKTMGVWHDQMINQLILKSKLGN